MLFRWLFKLSVFLFVKNWWKTVSNIQTNIDLWTCTYNIYYPKLFEDFESSKHLSIAVIGRGVFEWQADNVGESWDIIGTSLRILIHAELGTLRLFYCRDNIRVVSKRLQYLWDINGFEWGDIMPYLVLLEKLSSHPRKEIFFF